MKKPIEWKVSERNIAAMYYGNMVIMVLEWDSDIDKWIVSNTGLFSKHLQNIEYAGKSLSHKGFLKMKPRLTKAARKLIIGLHL